MDVPAKIRAAVKWLSFGKILSQILAWAFSILTIRLLAPEDYGLMALATVFISFLNLFEELGLRVRLVQIKELDPGYVRDVYGLSILVNCLLAAVLVVASPAIAWFFDEERVRAIVMVMAAQFVISSLAVIPDAMIKRNLDFRAVTIVDICQGFLASSLTLVMAWMGYGVWSLVAGSVSGSLFRTAALMWISPFRAWPRLRLSGMRETLAFGGFVTMQRVAWWIYTRFDRMLLGKAYDTHLVGIYSVGLDLAYLPLEKLGSTVAVAAFTGLSRVANEIATFRTYLLKGINVLSVAMFPVFYGIGAIAFEIVPLLLGKDWLAVAPITLAFCLVMPLRMINGPLTEALNSLGRPAAAMWATIAIAVVVVLGVVGGIGWGPLGVAVGWAVAFPFAFIGNAILVARYVKIGFRDYARVIVPAWIAAGLMMVAVFYTRPLLPWPAPSVPGVIASVAIGVFVYSGVIALLDRNAVRLLLTMLRRG